MPRARRARRPLFAPRPLLAALAALAAAAVALAAAPGLAEARQPRLLTGTYEVLAKDHLTADGGLDHVYSDVLRVPGRAIPLRLPRGHGLTPGTRIRVSAQPTSTRTMDVTSVRRIAPASTVGSAGTSSVLVILAYWTKPDTMTQAKAAAQFFGDSDRWFREVSYGKVGLAGTVTPWVRIGGPSAGRCYDDAEGILARAMTAARNIADKYDAMYFDRTVLYFPRCTGSDTVGVAGWAYEPGTVSWLNGYLDRRTTVHEQGHNYGLGHARSLSCRTAAGTPIMFGPRCTTAEYGDPYDAMGRSSYAAHFSGYRKHKAGWLDGRRRVLTTSSASFTLPPFEKPSSLPLVVIARSARVASRSYWLEFRRPVGMDARLPAGATGGVLVHVVDNGRPGLLLDGTPGDGTVTTAVLKPGTTWTSPDYVKIRVGTIGSTGARVAVSGVRPGPTTPAVPRSFVATAGDTTARLSWLPPAYDGGEPLLDYRVTAVSGEHVHEETVSLAARGTVLTRLENGRTYTVTVRARNADGFGAVTTAYVRPYPMPPAVRIRPPGEAGVPLSGYVELHVEATANPVTQSPIRCVDVLVDGRSLRSTCVPYDTAGAVTVWWDTMQVTNGAHEIVAVATDNLGREAAAVLSVTTRNPVPDVVITAPVHGSVHPDVESLVLEASATIDDPGASVESVEFYDLTEGWRRYLGQVRPSSGVARVTWNVSGVYGTRTIVADAYAGNGRRATSRSVSVTIDHPPAEVAVTSPRDGSTVSGASVQIAADARVVAANSSLYAVQFYVDGQYRATDTAAPYEWTWDTRSVTGAHTVAATAVESSGRRHQAAARVTVANVLPTVSITPPRREYAATEEIVLSGTALPGEGGERPDRVRVAYRQTSVVVPVAADGSWSLPYDHGGAWGYQDVGVRALTPAGLESVQRWATFYVTRPVPTVVLESPAPGSTVVHGVTAEAVVTATPGAGDRARVREVCLVVGSDWVGCTSTAGTDGRYRFPWQVRQQAGTHDLHTYVTMSDGYSTWTRHGQLTVVAAS